MNVEEYLKKNENQWFSKHDLCTALKISSGKLHGQIRNCPKIQKDYKGGKLFVRIEVKEVGQPRIS